MDSTGSMKSMEQEERKGKRIKQRMDKTGYRTAWLLLMLFCTGLACAGCSSLYTAERIQLMKTEGTVDISNRRGRELEPIPEMKLYSGYQVATQEKSYAWLDLDSVKLAKMDAESQISVEKKKDRMEVIVETGGLFFNIKEPLKEDETLDIRTSNMAVGIRGTCGWVEVSESGDTMRVYLLEGKVLCEVDSGWDAVKAGEMAVMTKTGEIVVSAFTVQDIPDFVMEEIEEDEELRTEVLEMWGLDALEPADGSAPVEPADGSAPVEPVDGSVPVESADGAVLPELAEALEQYRSIIGQAASYGYGDGSASARGYSYALVQMQTGDTIPALLLSKASQEDMAGDIYYVRIFQYDPVSGTVRQPGESLREGVASAGGFRGSLGMEGDGNGIQYIETSSGSGHTVVRRVTLEGDSLQIVTQWEGRLDEMGQELSPRGIEWHDTGDTDALDNWTPDAGTYPEAFGLSGAAGTEGSALGETVGVETRTARDRSG